jgi:hypothetical protein
MVGDGATDGSIVCVGTGEAAAAGVEVDTVGAGLAARVVAGAPVGDPVAEAEQPEITTRATAIAEIR